MPSRRLTPPQQRRHPAGYLAGVHTTSYLDAEQLSNLLLRHAERAERRTAGPLRPRQHLKHHQTHRLPADPQCQRQPGRSRCACVSCHCRDALQGDMAGRAQVRLQPNPQGLHRLSTTKTFHCHDMLFLCLHNMSCCCSSYCLLLLLASCSCCLSGGLCHGITFTPGSGCPSRVSWSSSCTTPSTCTARRLHASSWCTACTACKEQEQTWDPQQSAA